MKKEFRWVIESVCVSVLFILSIYLYFIIKGMYLTANYVPDIVTQYEGTETLSSSTDIGRIKSFQWFEFVLVFVLSGLVYYFLRWAIFKFRSKYKSSH